MINRTWFCLNRYCKHEFTMADADHPPCPRCGGLHVRWVPKPIAIKSAATQKADRTVADMQKQYGDQNFNSPRMHERMQPRVNPVAVPGKTQRFAPAAAVPGFALDVPVGPSGTIEQAYCGPTGVTAKVSASVGQRTQTTRVGGKGLGVGGRFEAVHRPAGGIPK
jgi:hypothetical protein